MTPRTLSKRLPPWAWRACERWADVEAAGIEGAAPRLLAMLALEVGRQVETPRPPTPGSILRLEVAAIAYDVVRVLEAQQAARAP